LNYAQARKGNFGFTLIEVMVATVLLGLGIALGFGALSSMTRTELRIREVEKMNLLAVQKLGEVLATGNIANQQTDGTFQDSGEPNYKWTLDTVATGTENLATARITVQTTAGKSTDPVTTASGLVFTSPNAQNGALGG
jgi:prepilin-type N-terminal cleavage/methylation domain-containing protein